MKVQIYPRYKHTPGKISLCMIMKNEAPVIERMLKSVTGLVDEVIAVDTGSTDDTIKIARSWGIKVLQDPWQDNFSRPRNISMDQATGDWILILDPDEVLNRQDHEGIRKLCRDPSIAGYRFDTWNYTNNLGMQSFRPCQGEYPEEAGFKGYTISTKTRLVQRRLNIRFQKVWHELLDYDIHERNLKALPTPIPIHHLPCREQKDKYQRRKNLYLKLGEKKVRLGPNDPIAWWELSIAEFIEGYNYRALHSVKQALSRRNVNPDRYFFYSQIAKKVGNQKEGKFAFEKAACLLFPSLTHIDETLKKRLIL